MRRTWLILIGIVFLGSGVALAESTWEHIPDGSVAMVTVSDLRADEGMSWLRSSWQASDRRSGLRTVFRTVSYDEVSVAVLPGESDSGPRILMVASLSAGGYDPSVFDAVLESSSVKQANVSGATVRYVDEAQSGQDFAAYADLGGVVMLGSDLSVVEEALAASAISMGPGFDSAGSLLDMSSNGVLFADNEDTRFARFLAPLERKWGMSLLLSADQLEWMASAFDVVDSNTITGTVILQGAPDSMVADLRDDAEFLGEAFRRKFMAEQIEYESDVAVDGTTVTLAFEIFGLEPLWLRLFSQGVLSIVRPE